MTDAAPSGGIPDPNLDPHVAAALNAEAGRRLLAAAAQHTEAAPITPLDTQCIARHVWFEALVRAGFTEDQALYLIKDGS